METAKRLEGINEYYFSQKLREIERMNAAGKNVINLGIGSPDLPPHESVIQKLNEESAKAGNHAYQGYKGSIVLRKAISGFYENWYAFTPDPEKEILPLIGSKEGIMHICMTYLNENDVALVPDPGYPTYTAAVQLAGAEAAYYDLIEENKYEPDFDVLQNQIQSFKEKGKNTKLFFVNYPHMPTGKVANATLFEKIIAFAKDAGLLVVHDNPYSFILNEKPASILSVPNAMEHAVELNSLSKSFNMAGWRVGMLIGSEKHINDILKFKSNMDSGMFLPVQLAAAEALSLDKVWFESLNEQYAGRRRLVFALLDLLQCEYDVEQVGMFVWAKVPSDFKDGYEMSDNILNQSNVFITPGGIFGSNGNNYIRVSLCSNEVKLMESINRIKANK